MTAFKLSPKSQTFSSILTAIWKWLLKILGKLIYLIVSLKYFCFILDYFLIQLGIQRIAVFYKSQSFYIMSNG